MKKITWEIGHNLQDVAKTAYKEKYWSFPDNITSFKAKSAYIFFKLFYTISVGKGQVIGRFTNMLPEIMGGIYLFEKMTGITVSSNMVWLIFLGSFGVSWIIGYFWMRNEFDRIDYQVSSERNIILDEIHKAVVKERRKM